MWRIQDFTQEDGNTNLLHPAGTPVNPAICDNCSKFCLLHYNVSQWEIHISHSCMETCPLALWSELRCLLSIILAENCMKMKNKIGLKEGMFPRAVPPPSRGAIFLLKLCKFLVSTRLWSMCSVVFHALTLKFAIQTSLSIAPKLQVCVRSGEKCRKFRKTSTPLLLFIVIDCLSLEIDYSTLLQFLCR